MSRDYLVPVGYLPMFDALDRARLEFPTETKARFVGLLRSGALPAWCSDHDGNVTPIEPTFWAGEYAALALDENEVRTGPVYRGKKSEGRPVFRASDLDEHLPSLAQRSEKAAAERRASIAGTAENPSGAVSIKDTSIGPRRGRKSNPDADRFWIEVCRRVSDGSGGNTLPTFTDGMVHWAMGGMDQRYDDETIRKKLTALFTALGWDSRIPD